MYVNPVDWHFSLTTYGSRDDWLAPTLVEPGWPAYDYEWQLTHEVGPWPAVQIVGMWYDMWDLIPDPEKSGFGTLGPLPWYDELILHIEYPGITADFLVSADLNGNAQISIDNIIFGSVEGYEVTGARFQGNVTVTGVVPEPATVALLVLGSLILLRKRKV